MESINHWKTKQLVSIHLAIFMLFLAWLFPLPHSFLIAFDIKAAYFFNSLAKLPYFWQSVWTLFNCKTADWFYDLLMILFIVPYIWRGEKEKRLERFLNIFFLVLLTILSFLVINRLFFGKFIIPKRPSPTWTIDGLFRLSSVILWKKTKEFSSSSFPADHASTIFMFILSQFHLRGRRWGLYALLASIPFMIPRMITGAHWFSDLFLGSLPIALLTQGWFFYTPLRVLATQKLGSFLKELYVKKRCKQAV